MSLLNAVAIAAEICRFGASDVENPFQRWFASNEVTCAGQASPTTIAATFREGQRGVFYVPRDASAFPASPNGRTAVPAGEPLWLFVLEKSAPLGIIDIAPLEAGTERSIDARQDAPAAIVGWLQIPESDRAAVDNARGSSAPSIRAGGRDRDPLRVINGAFVRLRNVPEGDTDVELSGRGWIAQRRRIKVKHPLTAITEALIAKPSATLLVNWSSLGDLVALEAAIGACDPNEERPHYEITIERCTTPERPIDPLTCEALRTETSPAETRFGSFALDDLVPGTHRTQIKFGKLPPVSSVVNAPGARQTNVSIRAAYRELNGSLTLGGQPLPADRTLRFPGGLGFSARKSGEYRAALIERFPLLTPDSQIDIAACDGGAKAIVLTDRLLRQGGRYDIDIPDNELEISVTNTFTREHVVATIRYVLMSIAVPRRPVLTGTLQTSPPGYARMVYVPERELRVTVTAPGYQKQELEPFTLGRSDRKKLDVQLMPLGGNSGRIVSAAPFESAMVFWFSRGGEETERAEISSDGTFAYANAHDASETMAVVSQSHPLLAAKSPAMKRGDTMQLRFPDGPSRTFDVVSPAVPHYIAVMVGGVRIPFPALREHQRLRRLGWMTQRGTPLRVADIAETGPIDVILGPHFEQVARRAAEMDLFVFPQFATGPAFRLAPGAKEVSFSVALERK